MRIYHERHKIKLHWISTVRCLTTAAASANAILRQSRRITDKGIHVVISTGRPFEGIPFDQIKGTGINYAITANGSGIYEISTGKCLYENAMDEELVTPILNFLLTRDTIWMLIGGKCYTRLQCVETAQKLTVPSSIKNYIITTRTRLDNILQFIHENS